MAWYLMTPSHYLNQCWQIITGVFLQEMLKIAILNMSLKIANLRLDPHLPGANELTGIDTSIDTR